MRKTSTTHRSDAFSGLPEQRPSVGRSEKRHAHSPCGRLLAPVVPGGGRVLVELYGALRLFTNLYQPSFKLKETIREGAKLKRRHHPPRDVTPISGPVPMRAGGVIRPLSIAGRLPGAYAPEEPSAVCSCCTPSCVALPIPLLPTTMRIAQYSKFIS